MPAHVRRRRRLAALATTAVAAATLQTAFAPPAEAGQVGVTISVQGAGKVTVVEGSLEDGGSTVCDWTSNQDSRVTHTCARVRNEEPFEAWVWLRAEPATEPAGHWSFVSWSGCQDLRDRNGRTECAVRSDAFGTIERAPKAVFRDTKGPTVGTLSGQQLLDADRRYRFTFAADEQATYECRLEGSAAPFAPCTSPTDRTVRWGRDQLQVRATDSSGNLGAVRTLDVDGVDTLLYPGPGSPTRLRDATFAYQGVEGGQFLCSLDGAQFSLCGEGETDDITYVGLAEGSHTFRVFARKGSIVDPSPSTYAWRVDTIAPTTTMTRSTEGRRARFDFQSSPDTVRHECRLTSPASTPSAWAACTSPVVHQALADGVHTFEVRAVDAAGNVESAPAGHTWTVDGTAPETSTTGPTGFVLAETATVGLAASETGSTFTCTLDGAATPCGPGGLELGGLTRTTHVVTAAARDAAGNTDLTPATRTWTVPLAAADLAKDKGWRLKRSSSAYGGAFLQAKKKGASLTREVSGAREVALVVGKGRKHGKVKVYAGSRLLATVRLAASGSSTRQLVTLATFSEPFTGSLRIVVATKDRPVRIEGLGVATR